MSLSYEVVKQQLDEEVAEDNGSFKPFDAAFYIKNFSTATAPAGYQGEFKTLSESGLDPLEHYVTYGAKAGFAPNSWFDADFYRAQYADVQGLSGADLLVHFARFGVDEGRLPSAMFAQFDADAYHARYPDIKQSLIDFPEIAAMYGADETDGELTPGVLKNAAIGHWLKYGAAEQRVATTPSGDVFDNPWIIIPATAPIAKNAAGAVVLDTHGGQTVLTKGAALDGAATDGVLRLVGDADVRIDLTNPNAVIRGVDLNGDGEIKANGVENNIGLGSNFHILDAYARNPLNEYDTTNNFFGDIEFDGRGFQGDGVSTDGNIVLGGLGADTIFGGIGNDFLAGGGVAAKRGGGVDTLSGGRNADFFFAELSELDNTDGNHLFIDGGTTSDDVSAGTAQSAQDSDWLLIEADDDDEPVTIVLRDDSAIDGDTFLNSSNIRLTGEGSFVDTTGWISTRSGQQVGSLRDVENVDASGNLYGFLNGLDIEIGGRRLDTRDGDSDENYGLGTPAQLLIVGSAVRNIIIAGYDNDAVHGNGGNDLLFGGNLQQLFDTFDGATNPNLDLIVNDGRDELYGGAGNDDIVFEADGGVIHGGDWNGDGELEDAGNDTLWLTKYSLGTKNAADTTTDGVLRFDLLGNGLEAEADTGYAGYGGADAKGTHDQTNYSAGNTGMRVSVGGMENVDATGLGGIDYLAAGSNDPELNFNNQQNHWGYNGDLDLRGTFGANNLYAGAGDDVLEGRGGNDDLMGGQGNDDFYFAIDGDTVSGEDGDGVDIIRRKVDADGDGLWDVGADGKVLWGQDFGLDQDSTVGSSALQIRITSPANPGAELGQIINRVAEIRTGVFVDGAFDPIVLNSDAIRAADTYEALRDAINEALAETAYAEDLTAELSSDGVTILIVDAQGRDLADEQSEADAGVDISQLANTITENVFQFGEPEVQVAQDRLIYKAYEDRSDNEGVDDDGITGSTISLGTDAYAEDLVVSFGADGTRLAEDQSYTLTFSNLTTEDVVQVTVNGVIYKLQVGVALNGTQVDAEDGVGDTQADIQAAFLARFANFINSFMDDDTAAGRVNAAYAGDGKTIVLTQVAYDGEETVFMTTPVVSLGNQSGGERATYTVTNTSQHEVLLYGFDGRDNKLNSENVLFWGQEQVNRAVLETAAAAGGVLNGSEAQVINGGKDDLVGIVNNLATDNELDENFAVHGDDYLIGGVGNDTINGLTGDDRVRGSLGNDVLDGGGDWYYVRRVGETKGTATVLNAYEAEQLDAQQDVLDIRLIRQTENGETMVAGTNYVPYFRDTLIYHQADFTAGVTRFTITLNDFQGLGDDIVFANGGAGTVGVDANGDGVIEPGNVSTFTNFENIRTVSGVGNAVAGDGQGIDTLNVNALSDAAEVGVRYDLTGDGTAGNVDLIEDTDNNLATTGDRTFRNVIKVDGVENVIFGDGDDILLIDETEAAKNNDITGDLGQDIVVYLNDYADEADEGDDEPTVTINVGAAHGAATDAGVDTVVMTEGRVGSVIATDTLRGIEEITLGGNTAAGIREDDELNVEALVAGASVNYVTGEIYSDTDGDFDWDDGVLQLTVNNLYQIENVVADGRDAVIVADGAVMSQNSRSDSWSERADIIINTYLNYDLLDQRTNSTAGPDRLSVGQLRAITAGTANTADEGDIPEVRNFAQFTFDLGADVDTVDYSNETGRIVSVVNFNAADTTQYVLVDNNSSGGFRGADDRIDRLIGVENIVASQGESVIDLTNSTQSLEITFSREIIADTANDRAIHRVQLSNLDTDARLAQNFIEYRDANQNNSIDPFVNAVWNTIQGSDFNERVELTDAETTDDHSFYLRGGQNEVNYNELTRSIQVSIDVLDYDANDPANSGKITADVAFTDGNGVVIGGDDYIESYSAQNAIAAGALRIEASQDAEDSVTFASGLTKLFILGQVVDGSDQITVTLGDAGEENSLVLTGFEVLIDADSDDVYEMDNLSRVLNNLSLEDNPADDRDTIKVDNDAVGYGTAPADTISLEVLNVEFGFDFDVLDVTNVTQDDLLLVGDTGAGLPAARDLADDVVVGNLDLIDSITLFDNIWFTNASITSAGNEFVLNTTSGQLEDDGSALFTTDATGLNFSRVTGTGVEVDVEGAAAATVVGTNQADTITGGGGDDTIVGGGGNDVLDGGTATEVRTFDLVGLLAADGNFASFDFLGLGNLTLAEALAADTDYTDGAGAVVDGAGLSVVGPALANLLNSNLAQVNADWQTAYAAPDETITSVTYSAGVLTFTFGAGQDVDDANVVDLGYAAGGDTGTFAISAESVVSQGGSGGVDTFVFAATAAANGVDTINGFVALDSATADDLLDFTAFLGGVAVTGGAAVDFTAGLDLTANNVGVLFNKTNGTLAVSDIAAAFAAGKVAVADNGKAVVLVTSDVDGASDTSNESYNIYYVADTNADVGTSAFAVTLVGTLNSGTELNAVDFFGVTDAFV